MGIARSSLGQSFTVSAVDKTAIIDTFINILKRREEILYRTSVPPQASNIAHVTSQQVVSSNNLSIADRSTSLGANRVREGDVTTFAGLNTFSIDTENFVVTDVFTTETNTLTALPLFYKHTLSSENVPRDVNGDLASGVTIIDVVLLDSTLSVIQVPEQQLDSTAGILYNNLLTEFNGSADFTLYYVKYTINNNGTVKTFVDLLDNFTAYRTATFDDLTATLAIKTDGRKVYLIEEVTAGFEVTLPISAEYAFKPTASARIQVLSPTIEDTEDPWYVRVTNGRFFTNISGTLYKYHIAEFLSQSFTPEPPIKNRTGEESTILGVALVKLDHDNIFEDDVLDLHIDMLISDADEVGLMAFSTDSSVTGTVSANGELYKKWSDSSRVGIRSIDHRTGFIELEGIDLKSTYTVKSTYSFEETNYEFTLADLNPISNRDALGERMSLFIDPDNPATSKTQTLFYLKSDQSGKVIESNWDQYDNDTEAHIDGKLMYYERFPEFLQTTNPAAVDYLDPTSHKFIEEFTVEASGVFLVLGDMTVSDAIGPDAAVSSDSRRRGGGIIDTSVEEALILEPETKWIWDEGNWDGIPYPGNASYFVEIPVEILEGAGGVLRTNEVRDIVSRHTAAGVYPVIKAYGVEIEFTQFQFGNSFTLHWGGRGGQLDHAEEDSPAINNQFLVGTLTFESILGHKLTVQDTIESILGHSVDVSGITVYEALGMVFNVPTISAYSPLGMQFEALLAGYDELGHSIEVSQISVGANLGHQADVFIPPLVITMENVSYLKTYYPTAANPMVESLSYTPTEGRFLVACIGYETPWNLGSTYPEITQDGTSWVNIAKEYRPTSGGNNASAAIAMMYSYVGPGASADFSCFCPSPAPGTGTQTIGVCIYEFSGIAASSPVHMTVVKRGVGQIIQFASPTTIAETVWVSFVHPAASDVNGWISPGSWTKDVDDFMSYGDRNIHCMKVAHKIFTSVSQETLTYQLPNGNNPTGGIMAAFKKG